ncbi:MAG: AEC family transporter [Betaproteobacteria bacterium]|nr:AEC family transporter [Betaproteobacteria bacterium]NBY04341.1 AEC family transporter [Betaproteobacteria bacterium]
MNAAQLLLPDFLLILCGYLVCRYTALNRSVWTQVEGLVYYFLFPVLLFQSMVRHPLDVAATSGLMAAGVALGLIGVGLSYSLPHLPGMAGTDRQLHAGGAQVAFRFNSFIGLALAERLSGAQGLQWISVLIGVCVPILNMAAVWPMVGGGSRRFMGELTRNPLLVATLSALLVNLLGLGLPEWMLATAGRIGSASIALGLMAAGAGLQLGSLKLAPRLSLGLLLIKHLMMPLAAWVIVRMGSFDSTQALVLMAFSGLPTASSAYVLAARMGHNGAFVAGLVTLSTLLGMASLPLALALAGH